MNEDIFHLQRERFLSEFERARPAITAFGDEVRQGILMTLIETGGTGGIRVGEIQKRTNISRSAVSHHLKVLRDAEIIDVRKEGTRNYYFIDSQSSSLKQLAKFWDQVEPMMKMCSQINQKRGYKK